MRLGQFGGGWSVLVAGSLVTLPALAADPPPPAKKPARSFSAEATREAVQNLLLGQWEAPADRIKRMGSIALVRAARKHADLAEVQYAYGLLLLHWGLASLSLAYPSHSLSVQ